MANHKSGSIIECAHCHKSFYIQRSLLARTRYCSRACADKHTHDGRRKYPKVVGFCQKCKGEIVAKNGTFDKPNRKYCSMSCRTSARNYINNPMNNPMARAKATSSFKKQWNENRDTMMTKIHTKSSALKRSVAIMGEKHWNWQGGKTDQNRILRNSLEAKNWRKEIFKRDDYKCQDCGARSGDGKSVILNADHIKSWAHFPDLRFDLSNGKTLCLECHKKTDNFGAKNIKKTLIVYLSPPPQ